MALPRWGASTGVSKAPTGRPYRKVRAFYATLPKCDARRHELRFSKPQRGGIIPAQGNALGSRSPHPFQPQRGGAMWQLLGRFESEMVAEFVEGLQFDARDAQEVFWPSEWGPFTGFDEAASVMPK